jgi:hypothetical protein
VARATATAADRASGVYFCRLIVVDAVDWSRPVLCVAPKVLTGGPCAPSFVWDSAAPLSFLPEVRRGIYATVTDSASCAWP